MMQEIFKNYMLAHKGETPCGIVVVTKNNITEITTHFKNSENDNIRQMKMSIPSEYYDDSFKEIYYSNFIKGNEKDKLEEYKKTLETLVKNQEFEKAALVRDEINRIVNEGSKE